MNIAIFGGAFNPIHKAHTTLAENVLKECNVEKVIFIPTFISPHKSMQYAVPFEHRVNMCKIATKDNDNFVILSDACVSIFIWVLNSGLKSFKYRPP